MPVMRPVAQIVDLQIEQTFFSRPHDDAFIERPGEHRRKQSEHVNFHFCSGVVSAPIFFVPGGHRPPLQIFQRAGLSSTISTAQRKPFFALPAKSKERIALIVTPWRPMIFPTSDESIRNS